MVDAGRHHLGTAGRPEWQEFAGVDPEGRALELHFDGRAKAGEAILLVRQLDVKLDRDVRLNGRVIGRLLPMEAAVVHAMAVPAGALRAGADVLTIGLSPDADDVMIEEVGLYPAPYARPWASCGSRSASPGPAGRPASPD